MRAFLKEIKFESKESTYIKDITKEVNQAIAKTKIKQGFAFINSKHTTLGILVNEIAEPNLISDFIHHTLHSVPEDRRSTKAASDYKHPTADYKHRCQDNPYCDEIDEDYNAAAHIRSIIFSHSNVVLPIREGKLELGKYQEVAIFEFDGRDGKGKNPIRKRTIQVWIAPIETINII